MTREKLLLAAAGATLLAAVAAGQAPQAAAPGAPQFKNLQVLPKDISRAQLIENMKFFSQSLGVRCTHCHVGEEGQPGTMDFASDAKREKLVARAMLTMVHKINAEEFGVTDFKNVKVTCYTCHRGDRQPAVRPPAVPPSERGGA